MSEVATNVTTAAGTLMKVWRKEQGNLLTGFKKKTAEYQLVKNLAEYKLNVSAREITTPVDLNRQGGTAMIPEGGYEAQAGTRPPEEITLTWVNANQRFTVTLTAKQLDSRNRGSQIERQMKYQAVKAMEAVSRRVGETFYGYSNGTVCKTTTVLTAQASGTLVLTAAYGETALGSAAYLAQFFAVEDRIAIVRAGVLIGIGTITAVSDTAGITVTFNSAITTVSGDSIVFANSVENTTLTDGTDYNKWPIGLLDAMKSTSVHGLSSATNGNWATAYSDTGGGRFSGVKLKKGRFAVANHGGGAADMMIWSQGVETDVFENQTSARRFNGNETAQLMPGEGMVRTREKQFTSEKVPPGHVFLYNTDAYRKFTLEDLPDEDGKVQPWEDGEKIPNRTVWAFSINISYAFVVTNRGGMAYWSGLTEQ